ncbi:MAG: hypothetical protein GY718_03815, partial [Lentisphaerae bacterium]|nr:hypothetical protein [Lentisphaerota bacterium]
MLTNLLERDGYKLKQQSRHGGKVEYSSACPYCNPGTHKDSDRLSIWPEEGPAGKFWCRQCQKSGDGVQYLRDIRGFGYKEACHYFGVTPKFTKKQSHFSLKTTYSKAANDHKPKLSCWNEKPNNFAFWAHSELLNNSKQIDYLEKRGINLDAIKKFKLGFNAEDAFRERHEWGLHEEINQKTGKPKKLWLPAGIVIPYWDENKLVRIRIRRLKEDNFGKYIIVSGSDARPFIIPSDRYSYCLIVEAELDGIMIHSLVGNF